MSLFRKINKKGNNTINASGDAGVSLAQPKPKIPWLAVFALAMGMLVFGVAESYGPVFAITNVIPSQYYYLSLSAGFIAGGFGALLAGILTDKLGRRRTFLLVAAMIFIGILIYLAAPKNVYAIVVSFVLVGMAAIGMETPILTAISESISAKYRGNMLVIVQNFGGIGDALVFIPAIIGLAYAQAELAYAILILAPLIALVVGYFAIEESLPWKAASQKEIKVEEAWQKIDAQTADVVKPTLGLWSRWSLITLLGIVQDVAFVWIVYDIGYLYFTNYSAMIPLLNTFAEAIVGILFGVFIVHKLSRKSSTLIAYGILFGFWIVFWLYVLLTGDFSSLAILIFAVLLAIPVELTWAVRALLEPEVFPTAKRGSFISYARTAVWIVAGFITMLLSIYFQPSSTSQLLSYFNISSAIVAAIFLIGVIVAIIWRVKGFETGGKSLLGHDIA